MEVVISELLLMKRSAFLRSQISSEIRAMVRDTFQCPKVWQRASGGLRTRLKMSSVEEAETTLDLKPQQTANHRAFATGQNKERWLALSEASLQILQDDSEMIKRFDRFSFVGRISEQSLQMNIFNLSGAFRFQSFFQFTCVGSNTFGTELAVKYADFTVKLPFDSGTHINLSCLGLVWIGIERIALVDIGSNN